MKKIISLVFLFALTFTLSSCARKNTTIYYKKGEDVSQNTDTQGTDNGGAEKDTQNQTDPENKDQPDKNQDKKDPEVGGPVLLKYEEFYALSSTEKDNYKDSFDSIEDFFNWLQQAQADFSEEHKDIEIGPGGEIDLSKLK